MKRAISVLVPVLLILVLLLTAAGCSGGKDSVRVITVQRSQYSEYVTADGNLEMPHEVKLKFKTPGTVKEIYAQKGETVRAGRLLAKMDDNLQRIALTAAQYDIELALNNLAEKIYPSLIGYPHFYPSYTGVLNVEQAQKEVNAALAQMDRSDYFAAASELRLALHDLTQSRETLVSTLVYVQDFPEVTRPYVSHPDDPLNLYSYQAYPAIPNAIMRLDKDLIALDEIQTLLDSGNYNAARQQLIEFKYDLVQTHSLVKNASGSMVKSGLQYPDTSTSLSVMQQVWETLNEVQRLLTDEGADPALAAEKLRMALNDMETGQAILADNELLVKAGLNMQALRAYNLNYQKALMALQKCKQDLQDTELLAPFDGV
ncbi:MAG TPA: hypothetical protein VJ488_03220, partial [Dehalococcoidia bacterium]|nr:hypothetical protein [Dehalococcoidia bacterium]